ncbi:hypothetical protein [Niallia sp. NCCP-28]|nr:hypothetical protein [Niallia sp. NCCP-28]
MPFTGKRKQSLGGKTFQQKKNLTTWIVVNRYAEVKTIASVSRRITII